MHFIRTVILALVALSATAHAASTAERAKARETFRAAQQHYKLAEYAQALDAFKETYRLVEDPSLLFNIAQCYRQLNKKEEAIRFYRTFLHDAPDNGDRASVQQIVAALEKAIKEDSAARAVPPDTTIGPPNNGPPAPPPATVVEPVKPPEPAPVPVVTVAHAEKTPVYKRWWLWTAVAGVVVVGAGVGLGIGLTRVPAAPSAMTQDGTFHPF